MLSATGLQFYYKIQCRIKTGNSWCRKVEATTLLINIVHLVTEQKKSKHQTPSIGN